MQKRKSGEAAALLMTVYSPRKTIRQLAEETSLSVEYVSAALRRYGLTHVPAERRKSEGQKTSPKDKWAILHEDGTWSGIFDSKPAGVSGQYVRCRYFQDSEKGAQS